MFGLDDTISSLAAGHGVIVVLLVAFALGLRHASDPDHLVAVSTLVAGTREGATRAAARLGAAWGLGHAVTLLVFGIPVVVLHAYLPKLVQSFAEVLIGAIIATLALRLLLRWRRGAYHLHAHEHEGTRHLHLHSHADEPVHRHAHQVRSPRQAFAIGLVHGMAGSAGVAILILAAVPNRRLAVAALVVMVVGTAFSMTALSAAFGRVLGAAKARRRLASAIPVLGSVACVFGVWYAAVALQSL